MGVNLDEAEKQILGTLLADFTDRQLGANNLSEGYEGPQIGDLSSAICTDEHVTKVDFDLALSDLESKRYVSTGPYALFDNDPSDSIIVIGGYSKREYASLTELGYKAARKSSNQPKTVHRVINNVHISGGQFSNLQLAAGNTISQKMDVTQGADEDILAKLINILEKQGQVVSLENRQDILLAIEEANEGNGKEAKSLLEKVCGPAWNALQPVIWPIFGELLKRSLNI